MKKVRSLFQKISWKKGSGDAFAFIVLSPVLLVLIALLSAYVKYTDMHQKLEYTAYFACRAASICEDELTAQREALDVARNNLKTYDNVIDLNSLVVTAVPVTDKQYKTPGKPDKMPYSAKINKRKQKRKKAAWDKGNYVQCTVSVTTTADNILLNKRLDTTITMAIETDNTYRDTQKYGA